MKSQLERLTLDIKNSVITALNIQLKKYKDSYDNNIKEIENTMSETKKMTQENIEKIDKKIQEHLVTYEQKQKRFFAFGGAKNLIFWINQVACPVLLIYFLFFKG